MSTLNEMRWDLAKCGWDLVECGWDLAEWLEFLTANALVATVLGSIPASSETVEFEGEAVLNIVHRLYKTCRDLNNWSKGRICLWKKNWLSFLIFIYFQAVEQITDKTLMNYETFLGKIEGDPKAFICWEEGSARCVDTQTSSTWPVASPKSVLPGQPKICFAWPAKTRSSLPGQPKSVLPCQPKISYT